MSSFLLILASGEQKQISDSQSRLRIGRLPECEMFINEPIVSRRHAEVYYENDCYFVQDTGSANGTAVNNRPITQPTKLSPGDTISVGSAKIIYQQTKIASVLTEQDDAEKTRILRLPVEPPPKDMLAPFGLLQTVAEIARQIVKNRPLADFMQIILRLCVEKTTAERAALLLLNDAGKLLPRGYFSSTTATDAFTISQSIAQKALDEKQAILVEDAIAPGNQDMGESVFNLQIRSAICTPLWKEDKTVGVLYVDTNLPDRLFGEIDLLFFSSLSGMLAEKIEISILEEIAKDKRRLDAEVKIASEIQARLFPREIPQIDGYQLAAVNYPCTEVGGDYYDIVSTDDSFGIAIADVTGKGVGAAMLMSNLQALLRSRASEFSDPSGLMVRMNNDMFERVGSDKFVTFFYLILNPLNGTVNYANAGHNRPLWRRQSGQMASLEVSGLPLGIIEQSDYTPYQLQLAPEELLLLYSDGITECQNSTGELFGEARLEEVVAHSAELNAQEMIERVISAVDVFRQAESYSDDMTLVVLKRL